ncbi:MAG: hypothetical protein DRQ61_05740 [Gammaproteobacteria bacterium]|nr:MAG: hypothetical protein DRQ56_10080 [Gammaproteobacteria bacterium]RLA22717.1 MAG: hypothetical protein DRQ61_05740 [Gammaproteobacteria bacterium]
MIGLAAFGILALYLWGCTRISKWAIKKAKAEGRPGWHYGLPAVLPTFGIMFWDWILTVITHQYSCATEGGFTLYKTLDQWKAENPGVAETLVAREYPINKETLPPKHRSAH